jgi:hypothetical protein
MPAEIRNMIWESTLIEDDFIVVTEDSNLLSGLLQVNRLVRDETLEIYYSYNVFHVPIVDYKAVPHILAMQRIMLHDKPTKEIPDTKPGIYYSFTGRHDWTNLETWIRAEFNRRVVGMVGPRWHDNKNLRCLAGLFEAVHHVMISQAQWEVVEGLLPGLRQMMSVTNDEWRLDYETGRQHCPG